MRKALIVYDGLPISHGGAHRLSRFAPGEVLRILHEFLESCTADANLSCSLELLVSTASANSPRRIERLRQDADKEFGKAVVRQVASGPNRNQEFAYSWTLDPVDVARAVNWAAQQWQPQLKYIGPALVTKVYGKFALRDPRSGEVFPYQGASVYNNQDWSGWQSFLGENAFNVRLSTKSTWSTVLSFPFEDLTEEVRSLIEQIQKRLPFKFSRTTWVRWQLNKAGKRYYARKLKM